MNKKYEENISVIKDLAKLIEYDYIFVQKNYNNLGHIEIRFLLNESVSARVVKKWDEKFIDYWKLNSKRIMGEINDMR